MCGLCFVGLLSFSPRAIHVVFERKDVNFCLNCSWQLIETPIKLRVKSLCFNGLRLKAVLEVRTRLCLRRQAMPATHLQRLVWRLHQSKMPVMKVLGPMRMLENTVESEGHESKVCIKCNLSWLPSSSGCTWKETPAYHHECCSWIYVLALQNSSWVLCCYCAAC